MCCLSLNCLAEVPSHNMRAQVDGGRYGLRALSVSALTMSLHLDAQPFGCPIEELKVMVFQEMHRHDDLQRLQGAINARKAIAFPRAHAMISSSNAWCLGILEGTLMSKSTNAICSKGKGEGHRVAWCCELNNIKW